jgi:hypothetical protein
VAATTRNGHHHRRSNNDLLRLWFLVKGRVAAAADAIGSEELNQQAVVATNDFA